MFGLLYSLFVGGASIIKGVQDSVENKEIKVKYYDNEANIYYDNKMNKHDKRSGRIVVYEKDIKTNDVWVKDALNSQRLRNITKDRIEKHYEEEKEKFLEGRTARTYVAYGEDEHKNDKCEGRRFKDLKTGKLYVIRTIDRYGYDEYFRKVVMYPICITCLMDIESGEFVRPIDWALYFSEDYKIEIMFDAIKKENKKKLKRLKDEMQKKNKDPFRYNNILYSNYMCCNMSELSDKDNDYLISEGKMKGEGWCDVGL